jgi:hypothetical protein
MIPTNGIFVVLAIVQGLHLNLGAHVVLHGDPGLVQGSRGTIVDAHDEFSQRWRSRLRFGSSQNQ